MRPPGPDLSAVDLFVAAREPKPAAMYEPKVGDVLEVHWDDAWIARRIVPADEIDDEPEAMPQINWGMVVKLTPESIYLAFGFTPDKDEYDTLMRVPKQWITGVLLLKAAETSESG